MLASMVKYHNTSKSNENDCQFDEMFFLVASVLAVKIMEVTVTTRNKYTTKILISILLSLCLTWVSFQL